MKLINFDSDKWKKNYPLRKRAERMIERETNFVKIVINKKMMIKYIERQTLPETIWRSSS